MKLTAAAQEVLNDFNDREQRESQLMQTLPIAEGMARRDEFLLPVGQETGEFLHSLILASKAKTIVELGTSYGYSTLFLADAARLTGGKVITLENNADKQASARKSLARAGLSDYVDWHLGDALEMLPQIDGPIDFVLMDIWKELYIPCLERIYPKLTPGALIVADNMILPPVPSDQEQAKAYRERVRSLPDMVDSQLLELGSGIELSVYWPH